MDQYHDRAEGEIHEKLGVFLRMMACPVRRQPLLCDGEFEKVQNTSWRVSETIGAAPFAVYKVSDEAEPIFPPQREPISVDPGR